MGRGSVVSKAPVVDGQQRRFVQAESRVPGPCPHLAAHSFDRSDWEESTTSADDLQQVPTERAPAMTITLVMGGNKGLGYETARRLIELGQTVYIGARDLERGQSIAAELGAHFVQLDVTDDASVDAALGAVADSEGHLDVLVNNAGISSGADVTSQGAVEVFDTNVIGVIRVTQAALPLLEKSANPVVVNVSSALGSFWAVTNPERRKFHFPSIVYGSSKAAVSMLTVQYAKRCRASSSTL